MQICERCGVDLDTLPMGSYPFCKGRPEQHGLPIQGLKQLGDEIDEWNENVAHEPVHFTSRIEKRRYLKEHGLQEFVRHVGTPGEGSDKSKHTQRWI